MGDGAHQPVLHILTAFGWTLFITAESMSWTLYLSDSVVLNGRIVSRVLPWCDDKGVSHGVRV